MSIQYSWVFLENIENPENVLIFFFTAKYERESIVILNQDFGSSEDMQIFDLQGFFNCSAMMDSAEMLLLCFARWI